MNRSLIFTRTGPLAVLAVLVPAVACTMWPGSAYSDRPSLSEVYGHRANDGAGSLTTIDDSGQPRGTCPLTHTDVATEISGFIARTQVTQRFENPFEEKIEAVYTFPLPNRAAVKEMTLTVGNRVINGKIKRREEAQAIYEAARSGGRRSALLDQERPNIFTQAVANILPGEQVTVTISYVELLKYVDGTYEFVFPMVVGPRYIPGQKTGGVASVSYPALSRSPRLGRGWSYDTDQVPDASHITPPITPPGTRAGHDISLTVTLDSGVAFESLDSPTHGIEVRRSSASRAHITLTQETEIPNKDFILRYSVAGNRITDAVLTHRDGSGGFFTLILQPPLKVKPQEVTPKELVFVLDTSGSMSGFPIEKAKETMRLALAGLHPHDTFNLITFAGDTHVLFHAPVPATRGNLEKAQKFLGSRRGRGGTEMMAAIRTALVPSASQTHVRIVCFMTDGYVGNDMAILAEVKKYTNARIFAFGIGSSVNRFLLDRMAELGRGEVEYVGLNDDGSAAAKRFHERVQSPLLTDVSIDWGQLDVHEMFPRRIPDLFDAKPLVITGRYSKAGKGVVRVAGKMAGRPVSREVAVDLPATARRHDVLAILWARQKIADLISQDFGGVQRGEPRAEVKEAIVRLGLEHRLLTQFTSFVAVEEMTVTAGGTPVRIDVPVELPEGVRYESLGFGSDGDFRHASYQQAAKGFMHSPAGLPVPNSAVRRLYQPFAEVSDIEHEAPTTANPREKLDGTLRALLDGRSADSRAGLLTDGKVEIQIWLSEASAQILAQLERAGFELSDQPRKGKLMIGRIAIEQLEALARLKAVRYIKPLQA